MVGQVGRVLQELGWSDGFHVPVADEANKALEAEVEAKMKRKAELTCEMESLSDHLASIAKHSHSLQLEHKENQGLISAYRSQVQSMDNVYRLTIAEKAKIEQEIRQIGKGCRETEERNQLVELDLGRRKDRLEELKRGLKWDKDALLAWEEEVARSDGDNTMLAKYMAEDNSKAKSLELRRQQLTLDVGKCRQMLHRMVDDLAARELEIEKTAVLYRAGHKARREVIGQWERSVQVLRKRDTDIKQAREEMRVLRYVMHGKRDQLNEAKGYTSSQAEDNRQVEQATKSAARLAQSWRDQLQRLERECVQVGNELGMVRRRLEQAERRGHEGRSRKAVLVKQAETLRQRRLAAKAALDRLKKKRDFLRDKTTSATERAQHLDETLEAEEKRRDVMDADLRTLQNSYFLWRQRVATAKERGERLAMQTSAVEVSLKQAKSTQKELLAEVRRQAEIKHNLEFKGCSLRSRIDRLLGENKSEEDMEEEAARIRQLDALLAEKTATANLLTNQFNRLEEDMRFLSTSLAADQSELTLLTSKRQAAMLLVESSEKRLRAVAATNQKRRADESVLRLRVRQKERGMERAGGRVYSLEKQRLELEAAMREREAELATRTSVMKQKKRGLLEERSKLAAEIGERKIKAEQLEKRLDITTGLLGKDEDGEQLTVTAFKIKTLQEKLLLQEQGDQLDGKIRRAEKEILAMEHTLKVVNCSNDTYKHSLACVGTEDPEFQEKLSLEAEYYESLDLLRHRQAQLGQLEAEKQNLQRELEAAAEEEEAAKVDSLDKVQTVAEVERELSEQAGKLERASLQLSRLKKAVRSGSKSCMLEERDVETRELAQQNMAALQRLAETVAQHPEAGPVIGRHLHDKQLSLPQVMQRPPSTMSEKSDRLTPAVVNVEPTWPDEGLPQAQLCGSAAPMARRPMAKSATKSATKQASRKSQ